MRYPEDNLIPNPDDGTQSNSENRVPTIINTFGRASSPSNYGTTPSTVQPQSFPFQPNNSGLSITNNPQEARIVSTRDYSDEYEMQSSFNDLQFSNIAMDHDADLLALFDDMRGEFAGDPTSWMQDMAVSGDFCN